MNTNNIRTIIISVVAVFLFWTFSGPVETTTIQDVSYTEFVRAVESGEIKSIEMKGNTLTGETGINTALQALQPSTADMAEKALDSNVPLTVLPPPGPSIAAILISFLPLIIILGFILFVMRGLSKGGGLAKIGKMQKKILQEHTGTVLFSDVAGIDEAKEELEEIVEFLREPTRFTSVGGKIPKGALLAGPPGTGKTLLARAIAGEAGVPFYSISGSDFVEMFVGVGASRVRDVFEQAKKNAPCIVFIDEIDAVGRARGTGVGGGNDEREQTLNQLLVEMDGFEGDSGIIILAATNRPDVLDPALLRPGRFDRRVHVSNPDVRGRESILGVHAQKIPLAPSVDLRTIARGTPGFSGADLANLVNESALMAARGRKRIVEMIDFEKAKDKIMLGSERRSLLMSEDEKKLTAYHEAGHAIVGMNTPQSDPIHKATIIPRDRALGLVLSLPERDHLSVSLTKYKSKLAMLMAGRAAEEIIFGEDNVTSGASSDIEHATKVARAMVTQFGFSKLGKINYSNDQNTMLNGQGTGLSASEATQREIEQEVNILIEDAYKRAHTILKDKSVEFERLAQGLLTQETLTGDEIKRVVRGEKLDTLLDVSPILRPA